MSIWCNCSDDGDGDTAEFYNDSIRTARKEHKCIECGSLIDKGEQYEYVAGKWSGEVVAFKTCLKCVSIREHFCPDGWLHGGLDVALCGTIGRSLRRIRSIWIMPGHERTIAMLVELVCELLENPETREEAI